MKTAMRELQLTARTYHRELKLSRPIADLGRVEAFQSRPKEDRFFCVNRASIQVLEKTIIKQLIYVAQLSNERILLIHESNQEG
jgi:hypothetical protein